MKRNCRVILILISVSVIIASAVLPSAGYAFLEKPSQADYAVDFLLLSFTDDTAARSIVVAVIGIGVCVLAALVLLLISLNKKIKEYDLAQEKLEQYRELWQTYINANESLVFLKDENLNYVFVNNAFTEAFRHSQDELIGRNDFDLVDEGLAAAYTKTDLDVLEQHSQISGKAFWNDRIYKTTKFPVRMLNGSFGVGAHISDVTEEEKHIQSQMRSLKRNNILLEILSRNFSSIQDLISYALSELLKLSGSRYGHIFRYDEETKELTLVSQADSGIKGKKPEDEPKKYRLDCSGIWGEAIRRREPLIINAFTRLDLTGDYNPKGFLDLNNFVSVPVFFNERIVAVAGIGNKESDYDEADVYEIALIMSGVWSAVQRKRFTETLAYERSKYYYTLLSIGDGVMVIDRDKKIEFLNTVACNLTGWKKEEAVGAHYKDVLVLSHEQDGCTIDDPIEKVFLTGKIQELGNHAMLTSRDGTKYYLEDSAAPIPGDNGSIAGAVLVFRDTTEKKEQRRKIEYMSFHDSLTGLYNRRFFEEELRRLDTERNLPISILMGDVNSLKLTNDIFDHSFGDLLLKKVAEAMRSTCRSDDIIARWGGDEFVILLPKTDGDQAEQLLQRIKSKIAQERVGAIKASISLGCDTKRHSGEDIMQVLGSAEEQMYSVKSLEYDETSGRELDSLISALFDKNDWEQQHALRVSEMCRAAGKALGLPESDISRLAEAARLHDIGKIILDPGLLKKDCDLSPAEINQMKKHPVIGYRILHSFDNTLELAETVLAHHERWDGSGYPKGLSGEKIPLPARIIAVAEAYDRMTHPLRNRKAKSHEEAVLEISGLAGTHFDPDVVSVFLDSIDKA